MNIGESYLEFCNRVLTNYKQYGFTTARDCFKELTGIDMFDNARKVRSGVKNIQKAIESGYADKFKGDGTIEPPKELNSFYKTEDMVEIEDLKRELDLLHKELNKKDKALQRKMDENTLLRSEKRNNFRYDNNKSILFEDILKEISKNKVIKVIESDVDYSKISNKSIILALSDSHYNFDQEDEDYIVKKYIEQVEQNMDGYLPEEIIFAFVGDLINHSRYSKKYTNKYTQGEAITKAHLMFSRIINYFIINYPSVNYKACGVCGNEATGEEGYMNDKEANYENGDYRIFQMLKAKFDNDVSFFNEGNDVTFVFDVRGKKCMINHGVFQSKLSNRKNIEDFHHKMCDVVYKDEGHEVDFSLTAHIHQQMTVSNRIFRNSSFEGSNSYSKYQLGIADSYRSQNMIVVTDYGWHCRVIEF